MLFRDLIRHGGGGPGGGPAAPGSPPAGAGAGTVVGGPIGIVTPGATSIVGWMTVSPGVPGTDDGAGGADGGGGGGGAAGTPAYPPISVGFGNVSFGVPYNELSIVDFQMSDGSVEPHTGEPHLFTSGLLSCVVPTHTAVDSDGVNPTIHASLFAPVSSSCGVPVLAADTRPPARPCPLE